MKTLHPLSRSSAAQRGLTLIEMLVSLVIAAILSLAIFGVLAVSEGLKRSTTSVNDIGQAGNYAMYAVDKWVRSAGSGFGQSSGFSFGCTVFASRSGTQVLPRGSALPAPFNAVDTTGTLGSFRLAPILIAPGGTAPGVSGQASDALIVMSGSAGFGEVPTVFGADPTISTLELVNSVSFKAGDLVLLADQLGAGGGTSPCMIQQVAAGFAGGASTTVNLSGAYYASTIGSAVLTSMSRETLAMNIGNVGAGNSPSFLVIGVGDNNTLFSYDLLQTAATPLIAVADGVFEMRALYGVDANNDGAIDSWENPATSAAYSLAALMAGTEAAGSTLAQIKAVRVGLIMRTSLPERDVVAPASVSMFSDLGVGVTYTRNLNAAERAFRYRVIESTIPLRNMFLLS